MTNKERGLQTKIMTENEGLQMLLIERVTEFQKQSKVLNMPTFFWYDRINGKETATIHYYL